MLDATTSFVDALAKWVDAIEDGDFGEARNIARQLHIRCNRLAIHPDFIRCIEQRSNSEDAAQVLKVIGGYLTCATEAREHAVKHDGRTRPG